MDMFIGWVEKDVDYKIVSTTQNFYKYEFFLTNVKAQLKIFRAKLGSSKSALHQQNF